MDAVKKKRAFIIFSDPDTAAWNSQLYAADLKRMYPRVSWSFGSPKANKRTLIRSLSHLRNSQFWSAMSVSPLRVCVHETTLLSCVFREDKVVSDLYLSEILFASEAGPQT